MTPLQSKNIASLSYWTKLAVLFWIWVTFLRPIAKTGLLFQHFSHKPKFHHQWWCSFKSFHQHFHSWQALYWHPHDFVSDLHSAGAAQIWLWRMAKFSVRISWHMDFEIPASSATSQMVKLRLEWNTFQTFWMFLSFFDVECPECSVPWIEVRPSLKCRYHSWILCSTHGFVPKRLF